MCKGYHRGAMSELPLSHGTADPPIRQLPALARWWGVGRGGVPLERARTRDELTMHSEHWYASGHHWHCFSSQALVAASQQPHLHRSPGQEWH